jgi:predicted nucleic acid-binding protein
MIIFDSNVWIFSEIINCPEHEAAVRGYRSFLEKDTIAINAIIASEVFHKLSKLFNSNLAYDRVNNILHNPSIEWLDLTRSTSIRAINMANKIKIRINDALIAEQALEFGSRLFTDDRGFKKVEGLEIVALR